MRSFFSLSLLNNEFPALHGLRVLGILGIVQLHATGTIMKTSLGTPQGIAPTQWGPILSLNAWFSMDLFFIMSGFLIGTILISLLHNSKGTKVPFIRFWLRRALRIMPLYYVFLFGFFILQSRFPHWNLSDFKGNFIHVNELLYLTNYPFQFHKEYLVYWSWSLSLEEHFYLAGPFLVWFLFSFKTHLSRLTLLCLMILVGPIIRCFVFLDQISKNPTYIDVLKEIYTPTHCRIDILLLGVLMAYLHFHFKEKIEALFKFKKIQFASLAIPILLFAIMLNPTINPAPLGLVPAQNPEASIRTAFMGIFYFGLLTGIAYFCLLLHCLYFNSYFTKLLRHPKFLVLATLGYGIYLVHIPVSFQMAALAQTILTSDDQSFYLHWAFVTLSTFFISAMLAYLLHIFVEKPALKIRDRLLA